MKFFPCRQISTLTEKWSKMQIEGEEVREENEELRERLGLKKKDRLLKSRLPQERSLRRETDKAMNIILQKEVIPSIINKPFLLEFHNSKFTTT